MYSLPLSNQVSCGLPVILVFSLLKLDRRVFIHSPESSASKAVNYGAVPVLLQMFCDWHRTDHHNRQTGVRKSIVSVLKSITMTSKNIIHFSVPFPSFSSSSLLIQKSTHPSIQLLVLICSHLFGTFHRVRQEGIHPIGWHQDLVLVISRIS